MDEASRSQSAGAQLLASVAGSPITRPAATVWWVVTGVIAVLGYLDSISRLGLGSPLAGTVFVAGGCVLAARARNGSAEARRPGCVRSGSLIRAAGLGVVVHGALLSVVPLADQNPIGLVGFVLVGAAVVVLTRPTTLAALGVRTDGGTGLAERGIRVTGVRPPAELSVPELVGELRVSAAAVRTTTDPLRKAELAQRRGDLLDALAARDPEAFEALVGESAAQPQSPDGPDGPVPG